MSNKPFKIFVVEDDDWYNRLLVHQLSLNPDFEIESFTTGKDCINSLNTKPDVVTLDYRLPDMKGLEVLKKIKEFAGRESACLFWRSAVKKKERTVWQMEQWAEAMAWYDK